jgi:outer membrane receptor for ferrienterochelin and colicins
MKQSFIFFFALIYSSIFSVAQTIDTTKTIDLKDVVVTGQFEPQSLKKSIFNVRTIQQEDIQQLAATNLADVLNQTLNITVQPGGRDGRSTVSLFGLDSQYFKILVDNIPLVNDSGLGNSIDLTQINLNDIERIEIIEGSMGVTHGANAVSGILNIITKKSVAKKWEVTASVQEETVGKEYAFFNEGRHIQNLRLAHQLSEGFTTSFSVNRIDFDGFLGNRRGENYSINDGNRGYTWYPKEQWITNGFIQYKRDKYKLFYKVEHLNERFDFMNTTVNTVANAPFPEIKSAFDERYFTTRWFHHLNSSGTFKDKYPFTVSLSYQSQVREQRAFTYNITTQTEENATQAVDQSSKVAYSTGTLSNLFQHAKWDAQLGYEVVMNEGFSRVIGENNFLKEIRKDINNYDVFFSTEYKANDKAAFRSGLRYSIQNKFDNQYAASLGFRYLFPQDFELRLGAGRSYRTPNFDELYSELIFSGHFFVGNENLIPETSTSFDFGLKKKFSFESLQWQSQLAVNFLDVKDRIEMALIDLQPIAKSQFINISFYQIWNFAWTHQLQWKQFNWNIGASVVGISQAINNGEAVSDDSFLFTHQLNSSLSYHWKKTNTTFSAYYKFNGRQQQFVAAFDDNGNPTFRPSILDSFSLMDASVRKLFYNNSFEITAGARNIFNIVTVNQTQPNVGAVHQADAAQLLGYGRSYFLKLVYHLNF